MEELMKDSGGVDLKGLITENNKKEN